MVMVIQTNNVPCLEIVRGLKIFAYLQLWRNTSNLQKGEFRKIGDCVESLILGTLISGLTGLRSSCKQRKLYGCKFVNDLDLSI